MIRESKDNGETLRIAERDRKERERERRNRRKVRWVTVAYL